MKKSTVNQRGKVSSIWRNNCPPNNSKFKPTVVPIVIPGQYIVFVALVLIVWMAFVL